MIDPHFLDEIKARTPLVELIGPRVDKFVRTAEGGKGLCPFHQERRPSVFVVERKGFWHCFGCGESGDCFRWVLKTQTARDFREAVEYLAARCGLAQTGPALEPKPIIRRDHDEAVEAERARKVEHARRIWLNSQKRVDWTPAASYLHVRKIRIAPPPTLRFGMLPHPYLRRQDIRFPAMVGAVQGLAGGVVAVHCTYLAPDGSEKMRPPPGWHGDDDWNPKIIRGPYYRGALRLTAVEPVMVIAEGIETSLSLLQALWDPEVGGPHRGDGEVVGVWAALSQNNLGAIELPDGVREVILAVDSDGKRPDATANKKDPEEIIDAAAMAHRAAGRTVSIARPPAGTDFNDMLGAGGGFGVDGTAEEEVAA